jgi:transposase
MFAGEPRIHSPIKENFHEFEDCEAEGFDTRTFENPVFITELGISCKVTELQPACCKGELCMSTEVFVGLDVSKTVLQIAVRPSGEHWSAGVDDAGMNETAEKIRDIHPHLVVMEAHGGVELPVAGTLASLGLPFALVSPRSIKDFTRAIGGMRQDRSQAGLLAHFAELVRPEVRKVPAESIQILKALQARRMEVLQMMAVEQARLEKATSAIQKELKNHIHFLEKSVFWTDEEISRTIRLSVRS